MADVRILLLSLTACVAVAVIGFLIGAWDGVSLVGTVASLVGVSLTVVTLRAVTQIRKRYVVQAVLHDSRNRLSTLRKQLARAARGKDAAKCRQHLKRIVEVLRAIAIRLEDSAAIESTIRSLGEAGEVASDSQCCNRAHDALAMLDGHIETVELRLVSIHWGEDDA